jgi:cytochrome P450
VTRRHQYVLAGSARGNGTDPNPQNDYIEWAITHAESHWDPEELSPSVIARRLACLCFAAIQSSVISLTNTLFDVASSPDCAAWLDAMRAEAQREIDAAAGRPSSPWSKAALARMSHIDSALRESMRLHGFVARGIMKTVVAEEGSVLPDGTHVPRGVKVGIQAYNVHRDGDIYEDAERYDAFRFVPRSKEEGDNGLGSGGRRKTAVPQALVSTSPTFLAFSHGPNAWFVPPASQSPVGDDSRPGAVLT